MPTIYLDHNIIQYFSGCFPSSVDATAEFTALAVAKSDPDCHFVLSPWSIYEAASGTDLKRIEACANFIDGLNLWFIPDHTVLAKRELRCLVFKKYFSEGSQQKPPFAVCYSQHLADLGIQNVPVGKFTAGGMIRLYSKSPSQLDPIAQQKAERPAVLKQLQEAKAEGKMTADMERQVVREAFSMYFPGQYPDGTRISPTERSKIIDDLEANQQKVFHECPSLWIDFLLSDYRIENRNRIPKAGDAIDLMHASSALVYCDAFVSHDGYTRSVAERVARAAKTGCKVVPLLTALFPAEGQVKGAMASWH